MTVDLEAINAALSQEVERLTEENRVLTAKLKMVRILYHNAQENFHVTNQGYVEKCAEVDRLNRYIADPYKGYEIT